MSEREPKPNPIGRFNDEARKTAPVITGPTMVSRNGIVLTERIQAHPDNAAIVQAVRDYDNFTPDNDRYGEHNLGVFDWQNERVLWRIDCYDQQLQGWGDPLSSDCRRVLTVMLAGEYSML